jgi:hypothetical protein
MSILVGTVDPSGIPACCRAHALVSADGLANVTVYLPLVTGQTTFANVATTRRLAVVASYPPDHSTVQLKGTTTAARLARDDELPMIREHLERFGDVLESLGIPKAVLRRLTCWPAYAIDMRVEEVYEQTPGPRAGVRLQ